MFNNRRIKALVLVLVMMINCLAFAGCSKKDSDLNSDKARKLTLVLDWTPNTNHTGIYVAMEKGYFAEEGIEVSVVQPPEGGAEVLVASGKAEFGISFQDTMAPAIIGEEALDITAVAALVQHNTSGIISRKGEGMDRPRGMEGKSYSTWNGSIEIAMLDNVVTADGGDFSKVELIPSTVTDEVSALTTKSTDSIWIFYGWAGVKMELEGIETDYFAFKDINPVFDYYSPVVIANNDFLAEESECAKGFLRALKKGYEYAIDNPEEAAKILCDNASELDYDLVVASQKYLAKEYKAEVEQWGYIDPVRWNGFYNWLNDEGLVEEAIPENTGFSNEYLSE
ncbi:MAG: ABC transporter substrate-binding protein [Lachnospiraceae bacterium]|nr:ABC transporter substrate-binding protein [Lachnospiraceae bacterium]